MKRYLSIITILGMMLLPFSACDGILEGIYDSPAASDSNELGFIRTDKELAVLCGYNDTVFTQLFKKNFHGDTPYQWLQKQTSYEIEFKLKKSTLPIKQIMLDYHFKTFSHFTTYCKRNIGATPNEIRKKGEESRDTPSLETYSVSAND
jgi:AraC family transcriptional regulator